MRAGSVSLFKIHPRAGMRLARPPGEWAIHRSSHLVYSPRLGWSMWWTSLENDLLLCSDTLLCQRNFDGLHSVQYLLPLLRQSRLNLNKFLFRLFYEKFMVKVKRKLNIPSVFLASEAYLIVLKDVRHRAPHSHKRLENSTSS